MNFFEDSAVYELVYFIDRKCTSNWWLGELKLPYDDLTYIYKGKGTYIIDNIPYSVKEGDIIYIPGGLRKAYTDKNDPLCCYALNFISSSLDGERIRYPFNPITHIGIDNQLISLYQLFNEVWIEKVYGYKMQAKAILMLILHRLLSLTGKDDDLHSNDQRIYKVKKYIINNYNKKIKIEELADMVRLHPVYFGVYFKKKVGSSVKDYINNIKINKAKDLLMTGGYNVTEAAASVGFDDIYYFSKVFKKITGFPPSYFMKSY